MVVNSKGTILLQIIGMSENILPTHGSITGCDEMNIMTNGFLKTKM